MKELLSFAYPKSKAEKIVLFSLFIFYGTIASYLVFATNMIDNKDVLFNLYFGFDTQNFVSSFFSFHSTTHLRDVSHPIFRILMMPVILIAVAIEFLFGAKAKVLFLVLFTSFLVSCSLMLIFRYMLSFLHVDLKRACLLIGIAAFFSTNLVISFTPESYPVSLFLLTFTFVYFSFRIKEKGTVPFSHFFILALITGGTTITNSVKCCIPDWFSNLSLKKKILRTCYVALMITGIFLLVYFVVDAGVFYFKGTAGLYIPWSDLFQQYNKSSGVYANAPILYKGFTEMALSNFFGSPVMFAEFIYIPVFNTLGFLEINLLPYAHVWQYIVIGFILGTFVFAIFKYFRNRFFMMLILSFLIDAMIHVVFHFGICEAFIYGAHWIFLVPLIWGWIYTGNKNKVQVLFWDIAFVILGLIIILNNSVKMFDIIQFARQFYPV